MKPKITAITKTLDTKYLHTVTKTPISINRLCYPKLKYDISVHIQRIWCKSETHDHEQYRQLEC